MVLTGCNSMLLPQKQTHRAEVIQGDQFVLVTTTDQDTLSSLAQTYLNDAAKGWWITQYNDIDGISPGQQLVIPTKPMGIGGLEANGYQTVPILVYTHLAFRPAQKQSVSTQNFERQINYLIENDFVPISLDQLDGYLNLEEAIPPNAVIISFDTAGRWVYDIAFPILRKHDMKAALFVPTEQIGHPGKLAWYQLARMASQGIDIGAYGAKIDTIKGKNRARTTASLDNYILQSKKAVERHLNIPCRDYSVPSETMNDLTTALLKKHGYRSGFTRKRGQNPFFVHNFKIRRSIILGHYNLHQFGQNLVTFKQTQVR